MEQNQIFTADGAIKNIVFVAELVDAAPDVPGWKFTALKPPMTIDHVQIAMGDYMFDTHMLSFYSNDLVDYPDEIDITIVHKQYTESDKVSITNGVYIFLENFIGELNSIAGIDALQVIGAADAEKELVPIEKLAAKGVHRKI